MDFVISYYELTTAVKLSTGMSPQLLHVHVGMAIYLLSQFFLGSRRASWMALSIVLEVELFNEAMNYFYHGSPRWSDTLSDIGYTLFWPSMSVAIGKYRRWRWARAEQRRRELQAVLAHVK